GDGKRVKKATGTLYWTGLGADPLDESDLTGNINEEYVFFNARRIARLDLPSGTLHYYFADYLGSASVITSSTGSIEQEADYYPYGGERSITSGPSPYKFTGKERDSESGLDNFAARYFASSIGRFMTPDTEQDNPSPIPYADWRDPQTLNLYSYVRNNTPNRIDPDGHKLVCQNSTTTDQDGTIHVNVACHEESDDPPIPQQLSLIDLIRAFFYTDDPEAKTAIGTAAIRDIMTGRVSAGTLNDLIPSTLTNSNTPPPPTIPLKALKILDAIDLSNSAGPNIQGGKTFQNREGKLPPTDQNGNAIVYKEWDVTPRQAGGGRGTERMVTGSDGSAYYTSDHYRTFQKVR
ncbi:MAG: RHS repeat-associated core domain-containing protein, partial [Terriglobales bacterium]